MIVYTLTFLSRIITRLSKILQLALILARVLMAAVNLLDRVLPIGIPLVTRVPHLMLVRVEVVALALPLAHQCLARLCHVLDVLLSVFGVAFARRIYCLRVSRVPVTTWFTCKLGPLFVRFEL